MDIAEKIIKVCTLGDAMMSDFELAEQLAVDALQSSHEKVKFYFKDSSSLVFTLKSGQWYIEAKQTKQGK